MSLSVPPLAPVSRDFLGTHVASNDPAGPDARFGRCGSFAYDHAEEPWSGRVPRRTYGTSDWRTCRQTPGASCQDLYTAALASARRMEAESLRLLRRALRAPDLDAESREVLLRHCAETESQCARLAELLRLLDPPQGGPAHPPAKDDRPIPAPAFRQPATALILLQCDEAGEAEFYRLLLTLAQLSGAQEASEILNRSLLEEERMAAWCHDRADRLSHT